MKNTKHNSDWPVLSPLWFPIRVLRAALHPILDKKFGCQKFGLSKWKKTNYKLDKISLLSSWIKVN